MHVFLGSIREKGLGFIGFRFKDVNPKLERLKVPRSHREPRGRLWRCWCRVRWVPECSPCLMASDPWGQDLGFSLGYLGLRALLGSEFMGVLG